jgi:hemerythrin-like domain-containing protein
MLPAGPLMIEHRLIEKMIAILKSGLADIEAKKTFNPSFIEKAVDFFRTYADRTHHGKEEDILFKALAEKKMSAAHKALLDELIREHVFARQKVKDLREAAQRFSKDAGAIKDIIDNIRALASFYPAHIQKEDKRFFLPVMGYLTEKEKDKMLKDFEQFDRKMIHEEYALVVKNFPAAAS